MILGAGGSGQQPGGCRVHREFSRRAQQRRRGRRFPYELHKHRHLAMDNPAWRLQGLSNARCFVCSSVPMRTTKMLCCSAPQVQGMTAHTLCRWGRVVQGIGRRQLCVSMQKVSIRSSGHSGQKAPLSKTKDRDFKNFPPYWECRSCCRKAEHADQNSKHRASLQVPGRAEVLKLFLEMILKRMWFLTVKTASGSMGVSG